jgi:hypothetical protein
MPMQYSYEYLVGLDIYINCTVTLIVANCILIGLDVKEMHNGLLCMKVMTRNMAEAFYSGKVGSNLLNCWLSHIVGL